MTLDRLDQIIKEVKRDMNALNIPFDDTVPIKINTRLSRALGRCCYRSGKAYVIELSTVIINSDVQELKNTIAHELLHSATIGDHHGGMWKYYADKMTRGSKYTITRLHDTEKLNYDAMMSKYKYKTVCSGCGSEGRYTKKTNFINHLIRNNGNGKPWYCSRCHGSQWKLITL